MGVASKRRPASLLFIAAILAASLGPAFGDNAALNHGTQTTQLKGHGSQNTFDWNQHVRYLAFRAENIDYDAVSDFKHPPEDKRESKGLRLIFKDELINLPHHFCKDHASLNVRTAGIYEFDACAILRSSGAQNNNNIYQQDAKGWNWIQLIRYRNKTESAFEKGHVVVAKSGAAANAAGHVACVRALTRLDEGDRVFVEVTGPQFGAENKVMTGQGSDGEDHVQYFQGRLVIPFRKKAMKKYKWFNRDE